MRKYIIFFGLIMLSLGCSNSAATPTPSLQPVAVQLKWLHQTQFAGFYVAEQEGYYAEQGIEVTLAPVDFARPSGIEQVLEQEYQFGIASAADLIIARSEGKPVKAVAVIYRIDPYIFLVKPDAGINSPYDFQGHKVAYTPGVVNIYQAVANTLNLDLTQIEQVPYDGFDLWECWEVAPVCLNYATNGPVILDMAGEAYRVFWPGEFGISWYGDVLFTTDQLIKDQPDLVEHFVQATLQGWQKAVGNPDLAVQITLKYDENLDPAFQTQAMNVSLPLIDTGELPIGVMASEGWQTLYDTLLKQDIISEQIEVEDLYTNQFVR